MLWGRGGSLSASPSFSADPRLPGAGARRAPGASPERGGQAGQPWGRSGRRHRTLRQAPRDAPWEPRAEATFSGELREDLAGTAGAPLASAAPARCPGPRTPEPGGGERGGSGPSLASPSADLPGSGGSADLHWTWVSSPSGACGSRACFPHLPVPAAPPLLCRRGAIPPPPAPEGSLLRPETEHLWGNPGERVPAARVPGFCSFLVGMSLPKSRGNFALCSSPAAA